MASDSLDERDFPRNSGAKLPPGRRSLLSSAHRWCESPLPEEGPITFEALKEDSYWSKFTAMIGENGDGGNPFRLTDDIGFVWRWQILLPVLAHVDRTRARVVLSLCSRWLRKRAAENSSGRSPSRTYLKWAAEKKDYRGYLTDHSPMKMSIRRFYDQVLVDEQGMEYSADEKRKLLATLEKERQKWVRDHPETKTT